MFSDPLSFRDLAGVLGKTFGLVFVLFGLITKLWHTKTKLWHLVAYLLVTYTRIQPVDLCLVPYVDEVRLRSKVMEVSSADDCQI